MPELPEVETIRRQLAPHLEGLTLEHVEIDDFRWTRPDPPELVAAALAGATVVRVGRAGKYLIWELDDSRQLLIHLRMTGALLFDPPQEPPHTRVRFELSGGHRLAYVDPRRFGTGHLLPDAAARERYLAARLGPEPLTPAFTVEYLRRAARGRIGPVKSFILDQKQIAGVGNIYADEALFRARVHPLRPAGKLTATQWAALHAGIEQAIAAGIDAKGASIDDFRHVDGAKGSFQDVFLIHTRAGEPCVECGREIQKLYVGGRGTYVCTHCQPPPRLRTSVPVVARPRAVR
jgi:formamidopyrimidine-DNA glycosylase